MTLRLSKIYTRGGDKGTTALVGGKRIDKSDPQLEVYGTVDELNTHVGMLRTLMLNPEHLEKLCYAVEGLKDIQNRLFDVGSILATPPGTTYEGMPRVEPEKIQSLEVAIDHMNEHLPELASFTLPGGGVVNAQAHICRTVCRRLERILRRWEGAASIAPEIMIYINRLSDYFFVLSRWASLQLGEDEFLWETPLRRPKND